MMKRFFGAFLSVVLIVCLTACGGTNNGVSSQTSSAYTVNKVFLSAAKEGRIDGVKFALGADPEEIKSYHHYEDEEYWNNAENADAGIDMLNISGESRVRMYTGDTKYYYPADKEEEGINFIAYFGDAYGYTIMSSLNYIKNTAGMKSAYEGPASEEDMFFYYGDPVDSTRLTYVVDGKYQVSFYFINGQLSATTIEFAQGK